MEFKVKQNSDLCQMTMSQFRKKFGNVLICAINRNGQLLIPDGEITILQNDIIYVTGNRVEVIIFHNFVRPKVIKSLTLIGAGKIAYYLLNILKNSKIKLKVINVNPTKLMI